MVPVKLERVNKKYIIVALNIEQPPHYTCV